MRMLLWFPGPHSDGAVFVYMGTMFAALIMWLGQSIYLQKVYMETKKTDGKSSSVIGTKLWKTDQ